MMAPMTLLEYGKHILTGEYYSRPRFLVDLKVRSSMVASLLVAYHHLDNLEIFSNVSARATRFQATS
ncbi:hypothetical protein P4S64_23150 [Vibrio sp. M60_M31a]